MEGFKDILSSENKNCNKIDVRGNKQEKMGEIEEILIRIWNRILDNDIIEIDDNFFDLGGHSLKAIELECEIFKEFKVEISLEEIFKNLTIRELAKCISELEKSERLSIEEVIERPYYPLTWSQKEIFILNNQEDIGIAFNIPFIKKVNGILNVNQFEGALKKLVERHEILRTSFEIIDEEPVQIVHNDLDFNLTYIQLEDEDPKEIVEAFIRPFDLGKAPLFRAALISINSSNHVLVIDMHHIISDGYSINVLLKDIADLYEGKTLPKLEIQYKDYAVWQNEVFLQSEDFKKIEQFWMERFKTIPPKLNLPKDFVISNHNEYLGEETYFNISSEKLKELEKISKRQGVTVYIILIAAYAILLSKHSNEEDIVIGSIGAGRNFSGLNNLIGNFMRAIPMRINVKSEETLREFLLNVKDVVFGSHDNQEFMFEKIYKINGRNVDDQLFSTIVNYHMETEKRHEINIGELELESYSLGRRIDSKRDLQLEIFLNRLGGLEATLEYNSNLFERATAERLVEHYQNILDFIIHDITKKVYEVNVLSEKEKKQLLQDFIGTKIEYDKEKTLCQLLNEQVKKIPYNICVICGETQLTYKQLDERSNALANTLVSKGVGRNTLVGLMLDRTLDTIVSIWAILKAGGAYVPIDPLYPIDRIKYMIEDSKFKILLSNRQDITTELFDGEVIDITNKELYKSNSSSLAIINDINDLAYVMYTSGSTGKPKGVMVTHKNVIAYVSAFISEFGINENDKVLQQASYSFDTYVEEVYPALLNGARIVVLQNHEFNNLNILMDVITQNEITIVSCTPLILNELNKMEYPKTIRVYISGGDVLKKEYIYNIINNASVYNTYGPTETTVCATYHKCVKTEDGNISIGRPIPNYKVMILDSYHNLVPIGVIGEICISGDGLSKGYWNNDELTKAKYVKTPFFEGYMYKTGDLGRWLPNGEIEFIGRIDNQVKIRGIRIELEEIENALLDEAGVQDAIVIDKEDNTGDKYLCAYIISSEGIDKNAIIESLSRKLPSYMLPTAFIQMEKLPTTSNGKIDRKSLPEPNLTKVNKRVYVAPSNLVEEKLVKIFSSILKVERIGVEDDFFKLGGNSLKAIVAISNIHKELNVQIPVKEIFVLSNIRHIADYILSIEKNNYTSIEKAEEMEFYPATSVQKRIYTLCQFEKDSLSYNIPITMILQGEVNKEKVEEIFKNIIRRHESLRTSFTIQYGEFCQRIEENIEFNLFYNEVNDDVENIRNSFIRPFDLSKAPLFRVGLIKIEEDKHVLIVDVHHIAADGISVGIILSEFVRLYNGEILPSLKIQYKDYAVWHERLLKHKNTKNSEDYWINCFKGNIPVLNMPLDFPRPDVQSFEGNTISFIIDGTLMDKLNELCIETGTTMYMVLFSVYNILLAYHSFESDIIVGTPVAGRTHSDLESVVGMFVNTIPIRSYPESSKTFQEFLLEEKENLLKAYEYQDYQLETLLEKLSIQRIPNRNPLFDVVFSFRDNKGGGRPLNGISSYNYLGKNTTSKFDFSLNVTENRSKIIFDFEYCTKLFTEETINKFSEHYLKIINSIVQNRFIKIGDIEVEELNLLCSEIEELEFNF